MISLNSLSDKLEEAFKKASSNSCFLKCDFSLKTDEMLANYLNSDSVQADKIAKGS